MDLQQELNILTKISNSELIKNIYPMVENIRISTHFISDKNEKPYLVFVITVNDNEMTKTNMYDKDFDPHYLVEYHIRGLIRNYVSPKHLDLGDNNINIIVLNTNGDIVYNWDDMTQSLRFR